MLGYSVLGLAVLGTAGPVGAEPPADVTAPAWPSGATLAVSGITTSTATVTAPAATDNTAVFGYQISINGGTSYAEMGVEPTVILAGLAPSTSYALRVRAYDAAGNRSSPLSANVTTTAYISGPASAGQSRRSSVSRHRYN